MTKTHYALIICNCVANIKCNGVAYIIRTSGFKGGIIIKRVYKTKHKDEIVGFLLKQPNVSFSVGDIFESLVAEGVVISKSTIYRQLDRLVEAGMIKRFYSSSNAEYCYRYVGSECKKIDYYTFHCEKCGKVVNVSNEDLGSLRKLLLSKYSLTINADNSVLGGVCEECM
ncbi:MAG: transcriptional repressor [Eubacterium sp.]|nr:transcriptional repressor [Eubacterium sp.]